MRRILITLMNIMALGTSSSLAMGPEMIGKVAPGFTLKTMDGRSAISLSDLKGQVIVLDFWASWCAPCRRALPRFASFETGMQGVKIIAVNVDDERDNAVAFLKTHRVDVTSLYDESKRVANRYDVPEMPSSLIIDKHGVVRFIHTGYSESDIELMKKEVESLL